MKLSAILVTAASLPLAAQTSANAADGAVSDKANWLKSNLASMDAQAPKQDKAASQLKLNISKSALQSSKPVSTTKLRPFVANRKLPSQRELELSLTPQTPRMASIAPGDNSSLSGRVSEFGTAPLPTAAPQYSMSQPYPYSAPNSTPVASYDTGYIKAVLPRMLQGQIPAIPGQIRVNRTRRPRIQQAPTSFQPPQQQFMQQPVAMQQQMAAPQASFPNQNLYPAANFAQQAPMQQGGLIGGGQIMDPALQQQAQAVANSGMTPQQQQLFYDHLAEQVHPGAQNSGNYEGMQIIRPPSEMPKGAAGPAPFPLSLLPQDSLKQFIGAGAHKKSNAPPSYFGSWHGSAQTASLPPGGFHSNMQSHGFTSGTAIAHNVARHPAAQKQHASSPTSTQSMAQIRRLPPQEMRIAAYPPYVTSRAGQNP